MYQDVPFAVFKLSLYESCVRAYEDASGEEASVHEKTLCGIVSGATTAMVTNPLDVLNTRLKAAPILGVTPSAAPTTMGGMLKHVVATEGAGALFAGLVPRAAIFGLGSGVFWGCYSHTRRILGLENLAR